MNDSRREDIQQTGRELPLDTFLNVSSDTAADIAKESITNMTGILFRRDFVEFFLESEQPVSEQEI
ncbi:hypothetical protein AKG37_16350 [Bacillus australimaris]|uniref:Uncharacterized protein n=1 Tax=Bacillus australimaris TaxID=1326968 RepID=A0ABD4QIG3_9BACI|nr:hypothetical protein [Bacillus australimaris]KPN15230.1 hypothetical protein AKG37_16350 [Bacillus australimaris]MBR8689127.1 hypothetical protein [Bacillus australimaris]